MPTPKKRRPDRTEKRATQRYTPPESNDPSTEPIPRPPSTCDAWHFYWCDNHNDWHHHDEFVIEAIQRSMPQSGQ